MATTRTHDHSAARQNEISAETCIALLKSRGFRITKVRRAIVELFVENTQPRSAIDLLADLDAREVAVNKTTVYRELDFLLQHDVILEIDLLDGMKRYELLPDDEHHHHHLVCTKCRKIQCVEIDKDLDELAKQIRRQHHFNVQSHVLEFFGLCAACE